MKLIAAAALVAVCLALLAGKDDIRRFRRMRQMPAPSAAPARAASSCPSRSRREARMPASRRPVGAWCSTAPGSTSWSPCCAGRGTGWSADGARQRDRARRAGLGPASPPVSGWTCAPATTGCASAATARSSPTRRARSRGSSSCTRPGVRSGRRTVPGSRPGAGRAGAAYAFLGVRGCDLAAIAVLPRSWAAPPTGTPGSAAAGPACSSSPPAAPSRRGLLLRVDGHGPHPGTGIRPGPHRTGR